MVRRIFHIISLVFAFLLLLSYVSAFVPPHFAPKFSIFTFFYPALLFINVGFIIVWIFVKWRYIIIPLACILIRVDYIPNLYQFSGDKHNTEINKDDIKILSYNVCAFYFGTKWNESKDGRKQDVYNYIKELNPSIIAFQDYASTKEKKSIHSKLINELGLKYYYSPTDNKYNISGNAIYSKYPIIKSGILLPNKEASNFYIYADLQVKRNKIIRVINLHLASFKIKDEDKEMFSKLKDGKIDKNVTDNAKPILKKLILANSIRSKEVEELLPTLEEDKRPTLIVGDFNDTPFSYTYRRLTKNLSDAFKAKGKGFGTTYNDNVPAYRIDYILYSKSDFEVKSYEREKLDFSDHYPVSATLSINKTKK